MIGSPILPAFGKIEKALTCNHGKTSPEPRANVKSRGSGFCGVTSPADLAKSNTAPTPTRSKRLMLHIFTELTKHLRSVISPKNLRSLLRGLQSLYSFGESSIMLAGVALP